MGVKVRDVGRLSLAPSVPHQRVGYTEAQRPATDPFFFFLLEETFYHLLKETHD